MKRYTFLLLMLILAVSLFLFFSGKFALGTKAQETNSDISDEIDSIDITEEEDTEDNVNGTSEDLEGLDENTKEDMNTEFEEQLAVEVPISGAEDYYTNVIVVDNPDDIMVLVNKKHILTSDYEPDDLVKLAVHAPGRSDIELYMREEGADAIKEFVDAAASEADLEILPASAYRSYELQKIIFQNNVDRKGSISEANKTSALPGQSEHQTGLAVDVTCKEVNYQIKSAFGETEHAKWTKENAYRFGFIIRYPKDKTDITGYSYEPWHLRYVGKDVAEYIYENDITLEEYMDR